jgi:hypothetical protein
MAFAQSAKTTGCKMLPHFVRYASRFGNYCYAPTALWATIVLDDF